MFPARFSRRQEQSRDRPVSGRISNRTSRLAGDGRAVLSCSVQQKRMQQRDSSPKKAVLDAALINVAQAAEHYEINRYGSLIAWAKELGRSDCTRVLQKTLDEEKATDQKLTAMAESKVNLRAASRSRESKH
jgi:hypothetical protein